MDRKLTLIFEDHFDDEVLNDKVWTVIDRRDSPNKESQYYKQGIKVLSLSRTNVQKTMVCYPKSKAEQQLIADCFRNLDNLITLHQREPTYFTGGFYAE